MLWKTNLSTATLQEHFNYVYDMFIGQWPINFDSSNISTAFETNLRVQTSQKRECNY